MYTPQFQKLLLDQSEFLKPFAVSLTQDSELAKDLYQETLYKAIANEDKYSQGSNIKAWLFTIMRNIFVNNYRRKIKCGLVVNFLGERNAINNSNIALNEDGYGTLKLKEISFVVSQLPSFLKKPFVLYYEGYKYHEIAEILCEPLGTIKSRIHFARKLLKQQLEKYL